MIMLHNLAPNPDAQRASREVLAFMRVRRLAPRWAGLALRRTPRKVARC